MMADIVLSYSNKDKAFADQIVQALRRAELDVWDFPQTQPGKKWVEEWFRVLREAQVLILLVSSDSVHSSASLVYQSWNYFLVQQKTIFQLILPNTPEKLIPDELRSIFY